MHEDDLECIANSEIYFNEKVKEGREIRERGRIGGREGIDRPIVGKSEN